MTLDKSINIKAKTLGATFGRVRLYREHLRYSQKFTMIKKAQNKPQKQLNVAGEVLTTEPQSKMKSWGVI